MIRKLKVFFFNLRSIFNKKKNIKLGLYGPPNSGKCVTPETKIVLMNGEIKTIKEIFDSVNHNNSFNEIYIDVRSKNLIIPSFNTQTLKIIPKRVSFVYAQKYKGKIYNILTKAGRQIRVTPEHPLIRLSNNGVENIRTGGLKANESIAIAKKLSLATNIMLPKLITENCFNVNGNMIQIISKFHNQKEIIIPSYIDEDLVSFIGYLITEAYYTKSVIKFSNSDEYALNHFDYLTKKLFNLEAIKRINNGVPERELNSRTLTDFLEKSLNFKPSLSGNKQIPSQFMGLPDNLTAKLLQILFDMGGYVSKLTKNSSNQIEYSTKSKILVEQVQLLLNRFGIVGRFRSKLINGQAYWSLFIFGSDNHRLFKEKIGFRIKYKAERLDKLSKCCLKRNKFYLPIMGLLENIRKQEKLKEEEFYLDNKHIARMYRDNRISYHRLEKMSRVLNNKIIKTLTNSDNLWDEIKEITQEEYNDYIYDLTIEDTHTFIISNGLIAHNTSIANRICQDWLGEDMGTVSSIPHETREINMKEKITINSKGKELSFNLVDTPGIATKIDYEDFLKFKMKIDEAKERAKEATKGIIDAIKWLDDMDCVLIVLDSTRNPYNQVNITIIGNLAARDIPVLIVANKTDLKKSDVKKIEDAFPQYSVIGISAEKGLNMEEFYDKVFEMVKKR